MRGTEKQIKWAEDIREKIMADFDALKLNEIGKKAVDYISDIEEAEFWIDHRDCQGLTLLQMLSKGTLRVKGLGYGHTAKIDPQDGRITMTWEEIVSDGKGGHKETRTKVVG